MVIRTGFYLQLRFTIMHKFLLKLTGIFPLSEKFFKSFCFVDIATAPCIIWSTRINVTAHLINVLIHGILAYLVTNSIALFLYRCMCVTDISAGRGGIILPVVAECTVLFTFVRSLCL